MSKARKVKTPHEIYSGELQYVRAQILMAGVKLDMLKEWLSKIERVIKEEGEE